MNYDNDPQYDGRRFFHKADGTKIHTWREHARDTFGDYVRMASGHMVAYCAISINSFPEVSPTDAHNSGQMCRTCGASYFAEED